MSEFELENRYIVIKCADIDNKPFEKSLSDSANTIRYKSGKPPLECLVIESDWPEYPIVLQMLKDRIEG